MSPAWRSIDHVEQGSLEQLVGRLLGDHLQRLHDRDAGSTNTASCREKCMMSLRGTIFFVISNLRMLFFSETWIGW